MTDIQDALKWSEEYRKKLNDGGMVAPFFYNKPTFYYDIKEIVLSSLMPVQTFTTPNGIKNYWDNRLKETKE